MNYQYIEDLNNLGNNSSQIIKKIESDGVIRFIPNNPDNMDWVDYQEWLDEGNTPLAFE